MLLKELLKSISYQADRDVQALELSGLSADSRTINPGEVFFAISGGRDDGAKYVEAAVKKGAVAIVVDAAANLKASSIAVIRVSDARLALATASANFYKEPTKDFKLIGITGTNGKTTLTYLLEVLLQPQSVGVIGTINTRYAGEVHEATHTTPDPVALNAVFAAMRDKSVKAVAMEVSSHALDQKRVAGSQFDIGIFTNLTQDHLDYHGDMESYYLAKRRLFTELLASSAKARRIAVVNADDEFGARLIADLKNVTGIEVRTFSAKGAASNLTLKKAEYAFAGTTVELLWNGKKHLLKTNLIGAHNIQNIMAALLATATAEADIGVLLEKLANVTVPGRLERVGGRSVFVDYAHTPDALENVITALLDVRRAGRIGGRLITVFGCGGDRDKGKRPIMGRIATSLSDVAIVTSDNPRTEDPDKIVGDIMVGIEGVKHAFDGKTGYLVEVDRARALMKAVELSRPEDIVLVAGKGHEDYQIVGVEKRHFDDREILKGLLP